MNKRKIAYDAILNIFATAIPLVMLQLIIFPLIAAQLGDNKYGLIVVLISLTTVMSFPFGNVINNIRLIQNKEYEENNLRGDFNVLLIASLIINVIAMVIGTIYYEGLFSFINVALILLISGLNLIREYLIVAFRLTLNYKAILINNLLLGVGYIAGFLLFYITEYWQLIFICGYLFSLIYITRNSKLLNEGLSITPSFKKTTYKSVILFISVFMKTALSYADKLLLFPLLGATAVSVYYSATMLGKIISMGVNPISNVMLSHLAKMERIQLKSFVYIICSVGLVGVMGYIFCIIISRPLLNLLYPEWADESMKLIYITTATAIFGAMNSVINPLILRFKNINWQMYINGTNLIVYLTFAFIFYKIYGLLGFCIGLLITSIIKWLLMIMIFMTSYHKKTTHGQYN